nr:ribonuclease H-like domain-containing protein [Tanacetum cinerariifolium]
MSLVFKPTEHVKSPRPYVKHVETFFLTATPKTAIPKPTSNGTCKNKKACFVCKSLTRLIKDCDYHEKTIAQTPTRNHAPRGHHNPYARMLLPNPQRHVVSTAVLTQSQLVPINAVRPVSTAVPKINVTRPRQAKIVVTKPNSPPRRHINHSPSPTANNFPLKVTAVQAPRVNAAKELNGGYVAFGGNPKGGKISKKGKIKTGKLDFDGVYFVKELKFNIFSVSQMCDKKNSVLFTDTECLVLSPEFKLPDEKSSLENQLSLKVKIIRSDNGTEFKNNDLNQFCGMKGINREFSVPRTPQQNGIAERKNRTLIKANTDGDDAFDEKEPEFEGRKPESEVIVSPSSSAQSKKHDDKIKREAKGKSLVDSSTRYRNLSAEFKDFSDNSINRDNAVGTLVPAIGQISTNNTNTFSAAGHSNAAISPTHGKSSYVDTSQRPDDPNMPELEDITYSDDTDNVGAEADFNNLETSITVSPIPTTRVHKDHHVTQIIGDLSSATQTRSMTRVAKDQEPKRVHQALKDPSWIEAMQEELLQFKMQKVWVLVDLQHGKRAIGFEDPDYPDKVYKVVKALYDLHQAPRAWYEILANYLLENGFQRGKIDQTLFIKRQKEGESASTPIDTEKPLLKDPDGEDVDVHTYRSMIGSLIYLTSSRPDIILISWRCKKQTVMATSSTEAEYVAAASYCAQVLWIQNQLLDYG